MAARWVGLSRPHNNKTAARVAVRRGLSHVMKECAHAVGAFGVLVMAAAMNFALFPDALAAVAGDELQLTAFVPQDGTPGAVPAQPAPVINEDEVRLLAATVFGEARSEGETGMRAVAHVMVNRVGDRFGEDLATVILAPKQFSVWNRGDPNRRLVLNLVRDPDQYVTDAAQWDQAQRIAREVLAGQSTDPTDGALFYHTQGVRPRWAPHGVGRHVIGAHVFYQDVPDSGDRRTPRVTNVAQIFGRPMLIDTPSTGARGVNAAATPTLNGVPINQVAQNGATGR
jgi:spore germination cell wall hydrolase CwlJ-like protein